MTDVETDPWLAYVPADAADPGVVPHQRRRELERAGMPGGLLGWRHIPLDVELRR